MDDHFNRILVVSSGQIGDLLLTTPLIRATRRRWPGAQIDVLGFKDAMGMLRGNPDVHELIEVPRGSGWRESKPLIRSLWRRYDLALITDGSDRTHLVGWIAGRLRSGLVPMRASTGWWKRLLLNHAVTIVGHHVADEKHRLLAPWLPSPSARESADAVVAPRALPLPPEIATVLRSSYVVIHVPSMWSYKQWPLAHYRQLVDALLADGRQVILTGGPSAEDRDKVAEVAALDDPPALVNVSGRMNFGEIAMLLGGSSLYIGPDTSITHLAAACNVPVIALFGPTSPQQWGPRPGPPCAAGQTDPAPLSYQQRAARQRVGRVIMMQGPNACVPCNRAGCDDRRDSRSECLEQLTPQRVIAEARGLLTAAA